MSFVTNRVPASSPILSAADIEVQGLRSADAATVTEPVPSSGKFVCGTVIANAASNAIVARSAVIAGRDKGSRSGRSSRRGQVVWPMAVLMSAAAIALLPPATHQPPVNYQAQVIRECAWNFHVILCRFRDVDPPQLAKQHHPQPTPLPSTG